MEKFAVNTFCASAGFFAGVVLMGIVVHDTAKKNDRTDQRLKSQIKWTNEWRKATLKFAPFAPAAVIQKVADDLTFEGIVLNDELQTGGN